MTDGADAGVLGIDVGGTTVKARLVGPDGVVLASWREPTPQDDHAASVLAEVVATIAVDAIARGRASGTDLGAIGFVVPGVVDDPSGTVLLAVNLGWRDVPVRDVVAARLAAVGIGVPIAFGQDVRAGALAEARSGAAADHGGTVAFVAVGTGLAAALVTDRRVVGAHAWAGEIGQVVLTVGPHAGRRVEEIASASAVARRAGAPDARAVADRVRAGDAEARAVWDECVDVLADALAWTTVVGGCATIVVGGGLAGADDLLTGPLAAGLEQRLPGVRVPEVVVAVHGDGAAAIGAAAMAADLLLRPRDAPTDVSS
ncbi:ROK family protein [Curtobacterium sp. RRHDQ10]|uniref:ROK family protein n=1 Tax=Curtobacterium phyllosphaerae TaxID=3413379 RepID=UPI003BF07C37